MAEYIEKAKLIEKFQNEVCTYDVLTHPIGYRVLYKLDDVLNNIPVADVVEVIRCKDCKHSKYKNIIGKFAKNEQTKLLHCTMFIKNQHIYEDDYCSYGERKTENA